MGGPQRDLLVCHVCERDFDTLQCCWSFCRARVIRCPECGVGICEPCHYTALAGADEISDDEEAARFRDQATKCPRGHCLAAEDADPSDCKVSAFIFPLAATGAFLATLLVIALVFIVR
jgi:hypothetical protein